LSAPDSLFAWVALIVGDERWAADAVRSVLEPGGYGSVHATTAEAFEVARSAGPDVIFIVGSLHDGDGLVELCRQLRGGARTPARTPILIVSPAPVQRAERLAALRAGAWDVTTFPFDAEEMLLRLDAYLGAKGEADRALEEGLLDPGTELYGARGVERRARELVAEATRRHDALACVVLAADASPSAAPTSHVARLLQTHGRLSDVIGRWNRAEFAVLAPGTDATGAVGLAQRLTTVIEASPIETSPTSIGGLQAPVTVYVGYEAVGDVAEHPLQAKDLLAHASLALAVARAKAGHPRIQRYESPA